MRKEIGQTGDTLHIGRRALARYERLRSAGIGHCTLKQGDVTAAVTCTRTAEPDRLGSLRSNYFHGRAAATAARGWAIVNYVSELVLEAAKFANKKSSENTQGHAQAV